jgi:hypothetical protein
VPRFGLFPLFLSPFLPFFIKYPPFLPHDRIITPWQPKTISNNVGGFRMNKEIRKIALKPSEVSAMVGIPEGTLANLRWAEKGPRYFRKPGGRGIFYLLADLIDCDK